MYDAPDSSRLDVAYKYDIFISYKRDGETLRWIRRHFQPLLAHHVGLVHATNPEIYVHEVVQQIPAGTSWPQALGEELGASRVLVALWTKAFLHSEWCTKELAHMLGRQQAVGSGVAGNKALHQLRAHVAHR